MRANTKAMRIRSAIAQRVRHKARLDGAIGSSSDDAAKYRSILSDDERSIIDTQRRKEQRNARDGME